MVDPPPYPGSPRWVKVSATITAALILLAVALMLAGGGRHGPWRHMSSADGDRGVPAAGDRR
jgi:hypothetical protein